MLFKMLHHITSRSFMPLSLLNLTTSHNHHNHLLEPIRMVFNHLLEGVIKLVYSFIENSVLRLGTRQPSVIEIDKRSEKSLGGKEDNMDALYTHKIHSEHTIMEWLLKLWINKAGREGGREELKTLKLPQINEFTYALKAILCLEPHNNKKTSHYVLWKILIAFTI